MSAELTIHITDNLLAELQAKAEAEGSMIDHVMEKAAMMLLESGRRANLSSRWARLSERGQRRAAEMGLTEADVPRLIDEMRRGR
ncbi:MAG: hypothetical protein SGI92_23550 [Bryobacteraceae bacterium]|nr:hypothetical protein [Bryobacteraceae bacterium]